MSSIGVPAFLKHGNLAIAGVVPASQLQRPSPPMASSGVAAVDELAGGLPRGALSEICGAASSGRTSLLLAAIAARTAAGEACALVDVGDSFDPVSAEDAGVDLRRVLWVRCGTVASGQWSVARKAGSRRPPQGAPLRPFKAGKKSDEKSNVEAAIEAGVLQFDPDHDHNAHYLAYQEVARRASRGGSQEVSSFGFRVSGASCAIGNSKRETRNPKLSSFEQALKATDLLLQAGGFGMVVVDLGDAPVRDARRIPLTSWFRFRRTVENTATVFVVVEREPLARQCASLVMECSYQPSAFSVRHNPPHARLLDSKEVDVEVLRAPGTKKAAGAARFATMPSWAVRK